MTTWSQNGLSANDPSLIRTETIPGTDVTVRVRKGPVGDLLLYAAARWHVEVEHLRAPDGVLDCWGYAQRTIRGDPSTMSNHASGSALDLRARAHPLATAASATFTPTQIAAVRRIVIDCQGCLRWGGDYSGRTDPMHIETLGTERAIAALMTVLPHTAAMPTTPEDDMPLTQADADLVVRTLLDTPLRDLYPDTPNRDITVGATLQWAAANAGRALTEIKRLQAGQK